MIEALIIATWIYMVSCTVSQWICRSVIVQGLSQCTIVKQTMFSQSFKQRVFILPVSILWHLVLGYLSNNIWYQGTVQSSCILGHTVSVEIICCQVRLWLFFLKGVSEPLCWWRPVFLNIFVATALWKTFSTCEEVIGRISEKERVQGKLSPLFTFGPTRQV